ncbi:DUF2922 domain-containing protein [Cerasibacillus terrae]|uniref:DUF2922 domain-containing protein n=1 Tax=Cerasibacillus terrae TaxID=2498845 RepID=A0A5C8NZY6_9BACI|nr:DUF2922 domain-containing protein [Cerasibacillus terrae]TXL66691.1 DUF2922 domain-containing protein [Cerasibacillus terrae]
MKKLELKFKNIEGKVVTLALDEPIEPVDPAEVSRVMDEVIALNTFTSSGGGLVEKHSARISEHHVEEVEIQ